MLKFAANLTWLFTEVPFLQRFALAAEAGFPAVECLFPYEEELGAVLRAQKESALPVALINAPAGVWESGQRGLASLPDAETQFQRSVQQAHEYALALGCKQIHIMAGNREESITFDEQYALLIERLRYATDFLNTDNIRVLIEPLNNENMPGYFIPSFPLAEKIIRDCERENIALQFDFYHCQKIHGNLWANVQRYWPLIAHIQIASVPNRNEPNKGELNYPWLFQQLELQGYQGWIGCEYRPETDTFAGLGWFKENKAVNIL
ncbi:2-oxo-tetronate isomerase [Edaphovirga cremea]|uniref:2-oxo-tetronate isomerase n=1 Tax=Edaphovirga cremea TaxID=2267246 RepID=UPI003989F929